ncbi:MAG TPA: hypothetical protein VFC21_04610 [Bryobacteraceae bacterium]|nr:hypothetical protein [Bryobacteraceae bacterium]
MKLRRRIGAVIAVLLLLAAGAGLWVAQSDWLRDRVRTAIINQAEKATGGRVEMGAFRWNWSTLEAQVDRFAIHGTEPAGAAPLMAVDRARVRFRILSLWGRDFQIERIEVEHPQAHLIVYPGGRTNLPEPHIATARQVAGKILDLKIGQFELRNGAILVDVPGQPSRVTPWDVAGRNLAAQVHYNPANARYSGSFSIAPLRVKSLELDVAADVALERNRVTVSRATVKTADSEVAVTDAVMNDFTHPVFTARYTARVSLPEAAKVLKISGKPAGVLDAGGAAKFVSANDYRLDGNVRGTGLGVGRLRAIGLSSAFAADPDGLTLTGLRVNALGGEAIANAEIRGYRNYSAKGQLNHFDLRQTAALETSRALPYDGLVSGAFELNGRMSEIRPDIHAQLDISPAGAGPAARGQVNVRFDAAKPTVEFGQSWIELPHSRIDVSGTPGQALAVKIDSRDIGDLLPAIDIVTDGKTPAMSYGSAAFTGTVTGPLGNPRIAGQAVAQGFQYEGRKIDSLAGDITVSSTVAAAAKADVVYGDFRAQGNGSVQLQNWKIVPSAAIAANVEVKNADMGKVLALAGHKEVEIAGTLSTTAQIAGTVAQPSANADVALTKGTIYAQPFDSITGRIQSAGNSAQTLTGLFVSGPKRVNLSARMSAI